MFDLSGKRFQVIGKHVLIRAAAPKDQIGGIYIPEKCQNPGQVGTVMDIGNRVETKVNAGDRVFYLCDNTVWPFEDRLLGLTDGNKILAKIIERDNIEEIHPFGKYIFIQPDEIKVKSENIYLSDGAKKHSFHGMAIRVGDKVENIKPRTDVYYFQNTAIHCQENKKTYHIMHEDEIIAFKT